MARSWTEEQILELMEEAEPLFRRSLAILESELNALTMTVARNVMIELVPAQGVQFDARLLRIVEAVTK